MATAISNAPTGKVSNHSAPARDGNSVKSSWKIASNLTSTSSNKRATSQYASFDLWCKDGSKTVKLTRGHDINDVSTKQDTMSLASFSAHAPGKANQAYTRASFWPNGSLKLVSIDHNVVLRNWYEDKWHYGPVAKSSTRFSTPGKPSVGGWAFDPETGDVSCKITAAKDKPRANRSNTQWTASIWEKKTGKGLKALTLPSRKASGDFSDASLTWSYDYNAWQDLSTSEYIAVRIRARSQGISGNSEWTEGWYVLAPPAAVGIKEKRIDITSTSANGRLTIPVDIKSAIKKKKVAGRELAINAVDGISLQAAVDVEGRPSANDWADVGPVDDGQGTALTALVANLVPSEGNYTWVRVKSWRVTPESTAQTLHRYSKEINLRALHSEGYDADSAQCEIVALSADEDGCGATVTVAYDSRSSDADDDGVGTEVSWATYKDAWTSNEQPDVMDVTWSKATKSGDSYYSTWRRKQVVHVRGLDVGSTYWFRARRYGKSGNEVTYGGYATKVGDDTARLLVAASLEVELAAPPVVPHGDDLRATWLVTSEASQTSWRLLGGSARKRVKGKWEIDTPKVLASGRDARGSCAVRWDDWSRHAGTSGIYIAVEVACGGDYERSEAVLVKAEDRPRIEIHTATVTAASSATAVVTSDRPALTLSLVCTSNGDGGDADSGIDVQADGDDVWCYAGMPEWMESQNGLTPTQTDVTVHEQAWTYGTTTPVEVELGSSPSGAVDNPIDRLYVTFARPSQQGGGDYGWYASQNAIADACTLSQSTLSVDVGALVADVYEYMSEDGQAIVSGATSVGIEVTYWPYVAAYDATVQAPAGVDWRDGATYDLAVTATDPTTGLASDTAGSTVTVALARKAPKPNDETTVMPYDMTSDDGARTVGATISLEAPESSQAGDVCDVWRVGTDGAMIVARGVAVDAVVDDAHAPYGEGYTAYRVVVRTADGDVDWLDYPYTLRIGMARIDFGNEYVELPYNLVIDSGKYSKDFEQRQHIGQEIPEGYWGDGYTRTLTISSDLIRRLSADDRRRLHDLGKYRGPCLVRTPDGCCATCNVTVSSMPVKSSSSVVGVSLSCVEVSPDGTYDADVSESPAADE